MNHEKKLTDMSLLGPFIEGQILEGKKVKLTVTGDSMYPLLKSRIDTVVLDIPQKPRKYDIVFYKRDNGSYILHRILKEKNGIYTIAGDNELKKEYPIRKDQIIAKVCSFTRKEKSHSADELFYRIYAFVWVNLFSIRPFLLKILIKMYVFFKKINKGGNISENS